MIKVIHHVKEILFLNIVIPISSLFYYMLELVYRVALFLCFSPTKLKQIIVYSPCPWIYHPDMGFNYTKDNYYAYTLTKEENGQIRSDKTVFYTDKNGNMSICKKRNVGPKILILGDSFTVGVGDAPNQATWPDLMAGYPDFNSISIFNYARDGIGILNMIDIAFELCKKDKYEQLLFAPYIGDFTRPKKWRSFVSPIHNCILGRCFVGVTDSKEELVKNKSDVAYVAKERYKDLSNFQIKKIFQEAENIANEYFPRSKTAINSNPLALHRIRNKTCKEYLKIHNNNDLMNNQIPLKKYAMLPGFSEKCSFIKSRAGRVYLILLPDYESLTSVFSQKKQETDSLYHNLMVELVDLLSAKFYNLTDKFTKYDGKPEKYFRSQVGDYHYSNLGLAWVAQNVAKVMHEK